ncbi:biotin carboxylase N-terminal domain-containing protein, partial [Micromonospora zhanjiangensis]
MVRRVLVANRGEVACRVIAACRGGGVEAVAVYSDADVGGRHVREADRAVRLPGEAPGDTYLRGDLLVEAARRAGADAVHPGYGFLAENAGFAAAVIDAGLTWIGPTAGVIAVLGSKIGAKALLAEAGVPMLPSHTDLDRVTEFPVLVKASAGGGGRGMRIVRDPAGLAEAVVSARREAAGAFGDGTVFIERYVERARHVEVQIFGDTHGAVVSLGERECSIQRRHQKLVEESPAVIPADLRTALAEAAVAAGRAVGYVGAGTVEFLLAPTDEFFFLEMNTRLQVEHPVTEYVTGLDLVRLQLLVAEGGALADLLGGGHGGPAAGAVAVSSAGSADPAAPLPVRGHAVEVRLCAEDPANGYLPSTGVLHRFAIPGVSTEFGVPDRPGLRLDSGVTDGSVVGVHYDSLLAKLIAWAPTRAEAVRLLAGALSRAELHGVTTNRDLLVSQLLTPQAFLLPLGVAFVIAQFLSEGSWSFIAVASTLTAMAGVLLQPVRRVLDDWNFRLHRLDATLRIRHGLLETRAQTVPLPRVQAVAATWPLLWRMPGWLRLRLDVAGITPGEHDERNQA